MVTHHTRIGDVDNRAALVRLAAKARAEGVKLYFDPADGRYFASSASEPGRLHYVTGHSCDCLGFFHHGHCKHLSALLASLGWLDPDPEPAPPAVCPECTGTGTVPGTVRTGPRSWRYDSVVCGRCHGAGAVAIAA